MRGATIRWISLLLFGLGLGCDRSPEEASPKTRPQPALPAASAKPDAPAEPPARGLGWKVTRGGRTLYLVGSVHVGEKALYPLPLAFEEAFASSTVLVEEIDLFLAKRPENIALLTESATYGAAETLDQKLSPQVRLIFSQSPVAAQFGEQAQKLRPWFLSVAVTMQTLEREGFLASLGIDQYFADAAERRGLKYEAIETVQSQVKALAGLPEGTQELMLKDTLEQLPLLGKDMKKTLVAWRSGDEKAVEEIMMQSLKKPEYRPVYEALFVDRNRLMEQAIVRYLATAPVEFVVLGSGHLIGQDGLVKSLEAKGYTVERL